MSSSTARLATYSEPAPSVNPFVKRFVECVHIHEVVRFLFTFTPGEQQLGDFKGGNSWGIRGILAREFEGIRGNSWEFVAMC